MRPLRLKAGWVLPVAASPIPDAAILIQSDGRIASVGPDSTVPAPDDALSLDLGSAVLIPGLVNTHTHLELTGFPAEAQDREFREWILGIRESKRQQTPAQLVEAARAGVKDCWAGGVTTVADTGDSGAVFAALVELGGSGRAYQEVFGPHPNQLGESLGELKERIRSQREPVSGRVSLGVSPHAPYTVSGPLYAGVAAWAKAEGLPIAVHIAESLAETEFVTRGTGPFAEGWKARGIPPLSDASHQPPSASSPSSPSPLSSPVNWLDHHGVLRPSTLCIHAIQLTGLDIGTLAARGVAIAHCPLSNARHRHGIAPLSALRAAGVRVGIGTDSVASVGSLDLLAEARAARALAGLSALETLALLTLEGAAALGLTAEIGSLSAGKWGDVVAITVGPEARSPGFDPVEGVLASGPRDILVTALGGRLVHRRHLGA